MVNKRKTRRQPNLQNEPIERTKSTSNSAVFNKLMTTFYNVRVFVISKNCTSIEDESPRKAFSTANVQMKFVFPFALSKFTNHQNAYQGI